MIARIRLWLALRRRKALRIAEQERSRRSYWKRQRELHRNDPLMRGQA